MFINNSQGECTVLVNYFFNLYLPSLYSRQCFTLGNTLLLATTIPNLKATQHFLWEPEAMPLIIKVSLTGLSATESSPSCLTCCNSWTAQNIPVLVWEIKPTMLTRNDSVKNRDLVNVSYTISDNYIMLEEKRVLSFFKSSSTISRGRRVQEHLTLQPLSVHSEIIMDSKIYISL